MWRICSSCGTRTNDLTCAHDGLDTETIRETTRFPGRLDRGQTIRGQYEVDNLIGVGGMGAVYSAEHCITKQRVAIKVLWRDLANNPAEVKRFTREARAASVLTHPNTVRVYDFGAQDDGDAIFMVMEYLHGAKLSDVLRDTPVLKPGRVVHIATQCCKALEEAHRKGIVHRDLKPDNVFLQEVAGERDFVKVLDFGLAKFVKGNFERDTLTKTGYVVGSPEYMAPEQAIGSEIGPAVDVYSLGVLMYECLTGDLPFDAETTAQVLRKHIMEAAPRMFETQQSEVPKSLERVVMQCLEKDPASRPPSAESLRIQLLKAHDRRAQHRKSGLRRVRDTQREVARTLDEARAAPAAGQRPSRVTAPGAVAETPIGSDVVSATVPNVRDLEDDADLRGRGKTTRRQITKTNVGDSLDNDVPTRIHGSHDTTRQRGQGASGPISGWLVIAVVAMIAVGIAVVALIDF